jgi:hypothetical protein
VRSYPVHRVVSVDAPELLLTVIVEIQVEIFEIISVEKLDPPLVVPVIK